MRTSTVGSCSSSADMAAVVVARRERARARRASGEVGRRATSGGVTQFWTRALYAKDEERWFDITLD